MNNNNSEIAAMEVDEEEHDDPFLQFVDYAISVLSPPIENNDDEEEENDRPGWSWVMGRVIKTCKAYSSGVTPAILLSELSQVTYFLILNMSSVLIVLENISINCFFVRLKMIVQSTKTRRLDKTV